MCFSPQRRTIFQHLNFQKWSRTLSFLSFLLPNVLFATAACNFWCHLSAPTSAPAALTGLLLDWPDTRIYEKTQHFVTSLTFGACVSSFLLTFWLLHLLSTDLTTLLLLFNSPYCRKFLFKLPSIKRTNPYGWCSYGWCPKEGVLFVHEQIPTRGEADFAVSTNKCMLYSIACSTCEDKNTGHLRIPF